MRLIYDFFLIFNLLILSFLKRSCLRVGCSLRADFLYNGPAATHAGRAAWSKRTSSGTVANWHPVKFDFRIMKIGLALCLN